MLLFYKNSYSPLRQDGKNIPMPVVPAMDACAGSAEKISNDSKISKAVPAQLFRAEASHICFQFSPVGTRVFPRKIH